MNAFNQLFGQNGVDPRDFQGLVENCKELQRQVDELRSVLGSDLVADNSSLGAGLNVTQPQNLREGRLLLADVIYAIPGINFYRLSLDLGNTEIKGVATSETGGLLGISDAGVYLPGSKVLVLRFGNESICYVLKAIPPILTDAAFNHADRVVTGSNVGIDREFSLYSVVQNDAVGDIPPRGDDQPMDLTGGEFGKFSKTGGGIFLDLFMAYIRVSELAGIWFHLFDNYGRLNAHNFDLRTALGENSVRSVYSELQSIRGEALYLHERFGSLLVDSSFDPKSPLAVRFTEPVGAFEPKSGDPKPYFRLREYGGYLGQLLTREVVAPTVRSGQHSFTNPLPSRTLYREQLSADGQLSRVSATGFSNIKYRALPQIDQIAAAEDGTSDTPENYRPAGVGENGREHDFPLEFPTQETENGQAGLVDRIAYEAHWKQVRQFVEHEKQFKLTPVDSSGGLNFQELSSRYSLTPPEPVEELQVTSTSAPRKLYNTTSGDITEDDGTRHIFGPAGQCITLGTDGHIRLSAPGDIIHQCRRMVMLASEDIILRAVDSIDVTTAKKDIRLKAEGNFEIGAGLGGSGRFLIDHRGVGTSQFIGKQGEDISGGGFVIKTRSQLQTYSSGAYLRTGGGEGLQSGEFVIDVAQGENNFFVTAAGAIVRSRDGLRLASPAEDQVENLYVLSPTFCILPAGTFIDGSLITGENKNSLFGGNVSILNGHVASQNSEQFSGLVGVLTNNKSKSLKDAQDSLKRTQNSAKQTVRQINTSLKSLDERLYDETTQPGHEDYINGLGFSFRTDTQYGTDNGFVLPATLWQTLHGDRASRYWDEPTVEHQSELGAPYPGYKAWFQEDAYKTLSPELVDVATGQPAETSVFRDFTGTTSRRSKLATSYPIL